MYLKSITLKNTGPIQNLKFQFPFKDGKPKPLLLVGRNGSGKSTLISFIVNALVVMKQRVYEDVEVDKGKVYRLRSPLGIYGDSQYYFAQVNFDRGVSLIEWQLNKPKKKLTEPVGLEEVDPSWQNVPAMETSYFELPLGELSAPHILEEVITQHCHLFFPADRFEPPDWLNVENLSTELKLPEPSRMKGRTERRIFSRNRLKPTLEWLYSVIFDMMIFEHQNATIPTPENGQGLSVRIPTPGKGHAVFGSVQAVLKEVLCEETTDQLQLTIGDRRGRIISATIRRDGQVVRAIKDLTSLSAGESALFCLFSSIIRDADLSSMVFNSPEEIVGTVLIDEADLHLHLNLQYSVLPRLITLFPRIQFVISAHAPMVALGIQNVFGETGFEIREMPRGNLISSESYSEFLSAFKLFSTTKTFQEEVLTKINEGTKPALLVEGKTDALLISTAWEKLKPNTPIPFEPIPCGIEPFIGHRNGGAEMLRRCTEFLSIVTDRPITSMFDNDSSGANAFNSLAAKAGFSIGKDELHKKHETKPINAILLPTPIGREDFSSSVKTAHRYLEIEHYFSDELLREHGLAGEPVLPGAKVFEIEANSKKKLAFAESAKGFESIKFSGFDMLFSRLSEIFG